jgi:RHH-type transcriptional regulator, proline utilization regulon repressor / proline dehydrogenase / delta 1-pyrroline-5-carboxylate dehydrogenase
MRTEYLANQSALRVAITAAYDRDETQCVEDVLDIARLSPHQQEVIHHRAHTLVEQVRTARKKEGGIDAFMQQYDLSSEEGIALMCLAEALLRIPDSSTIDKLLEDKIGSSDWQKHLGSSDSWFVNAATWSLMLTGKIYDKNEESDKKLGSAVKKLAHKSGGGVIRQAVRQGMKHLGKQFVMGRTIDEAIKRAKEAEKAGYTYSYDMLGEAAHTHEDALRYYQSYETAIHAIGKKAKATSPETAPGLSVKLSALHPRYELAQRQIAVPVLVERLHALAVLAKKYNIGLTVDAEEADRLELSLDIIEAVYSSTDLSGWEGFGLAVQAYQKRAPYVIDWLIDLAKKHGRKIMVRLVKGAYWDTEVKNAQAMGFDSYPVYTRKNNTDVSYIACMKKLLDARSVIYSQFATHNAHSLATVIELAGDDEGYEFQCLHGMGRPLYDQVVGKKKLNIPCRIYAPVGQHEDLLAYLVRRLLENGANTSFVNRITDEGEPIDKIIEDPVARVAGLTTKPHPHIPLPKEIYGPNRINARGINLANNNELEALEKGLTKAAAKQYEARPMIAGLKIEGETKGIYSPTNCQTKVGTLLQANEEQCIEAATIAKKYHAQWDDLGIEKRSDLLEKLGEKLEEHTEQLMAILIKEAGKTYGDAIAEVREAVDFCRYYANQARETLSVKTLPGPTGELNQLSLHGRGTFLCVSPWNFPLAIFMGQVVAALVAGNCVLAKPAEQTSLIGAYAVELMYEVGFPRESIQLVTGRGSVIGASLVSNEDVNGIMFTGSTETAKIIQRSLAEREGEIIPFIAETGGQNCMLIDSSSLPEQVIVDVVDSAFGSAGQRCSALRVLFLQEDVADTMIEMLVGAMRSLNVGDPSLISTDIGPVIDEGSHDILQAHAKRMKKEAKLLYEVELDASTRKGSFFAPVAFEIDSIKMLEREVFGPILHVVRYKTSELDQVIDDINGSGYGLTFGVHSRIGHTVAYLQKRMQVGNMYVNRNMVGAVVGVQPFGGEGLSGTGPKAGGPNYLPRLCVERTISINTTASGGNATLLSLEEGDE